MGIIHNQEVVAFKLKTIANYETVRFDFLKATHN
jgi:hypothetical protein